MRDGKHEQLNVAIYFTLGFCEMVLTKEGGDKKETIIIQYVKSCRGDKHKISMGL